MRLSVVVPCYNEEAVLPKLFASLSATLPQVAEEFEVILVDDGSRDRTLQVLRDQTAKDSHFKYFSLSRNFGKESAMLAGLSQVRGQIVAIMDADLQHPPQLLQKMVPLIGDECDQVVARRTRTGDAPVRTFTSRLYYHIFNAFVSVKIEDGVGDFRVLSRRAVNALLCLSETNRFSKGLFSWIGFQTKTVDYANVAREDGVTKWRMSDLLNYGIDGVLAFNTRPLRFAIWVGMAFSMMAFIYAVWVLGDAILHGNSVPGYVTTISAIVGFGGLQMILLGILGEYMGRIYAETKHRPHFLFQESSYGDETPITVSLGVHHAYETDAEDCK